MTEAQKPAASLDQTANDRFLQAKERRERNEKAKASRQPGDRQQDERERVADLGGPKLKLSVRGEIPGYTMYWENDEDGKIEDLLVDGFDFVSPGEVARASDVVADMDLSERISRYVGRREDGSPLRAYLMKCPNELWKAREARSQRQASEWDNQVHGKMNADSSEGRYSPKGVSTTFATNTSMKEALNG